MILLVTLFLQTIITLDKPTSNNAYELKLDFEVKIESEFYNKTNSSLTPDGDLIVLDRGNRKVKIFNRNGELLRSFGSEGNGPGEFAGPSSILTVEDMLCVKDLGGPSFFDYDFNLLFETNYSKTGNRNLDIVENRFVYRSADFSDYILVNKDSGLGEKIKLNVKKYDHGFPKGTNPFFAYPKYFQPTKVGVIGSYYGDYVLEVRDRNYNLTHIIKKDTPIRYRKERPKIRAIGNPTKQQKKMIAKQLNQALKERFPAVWAVLGDTKHGILIKTAESQLNYRVLTLDLISHDFVLLAEIRHEFEDYVISSKIKNGKIILDLKNREIGPYVQVYDLVKVN